jgi:hypothetical protein
MSSLDTYSAFINTINKEFLLTFIGGLAIAQIEEKNKKRSAFTCPNNACGRSFTKPLQALNLQQDSEGTYDACPYCLTEINVNSQPDVTIDKPEQLEPEQLEPEQLEPEVPAETEPEVEEAEAVPHKDEVAETPSGCTHYLGYLSEKASNDNIPDECMMCKDIVSCMLKKMKA